MADDVTLPGTGSIVAADEIDGVKYQRVKISVGAEGTTNDLAPGQAAMTASLPVAIASDQAAVPVSLTTLPAGLNDIGGVGISDLFAALKHILNQLTRPIWLNLTSGQFRGIDTVTTVTNITALNNYGGSAIDAAYTIPMRQEWNISIRSRIS